MLGYMTKQQALDEGFTHHGKYFGIPIYITDEECPMVAAKFAPLDWLMIASHYVEGLLHSIFWPEDEPVFQFLIGDKII